MSRLDPHFRLRIPAALKAEIEMSAAAKGKSMTAEIVARIQGATDLRDSIAIVVLQSVLRVKVTSSAKAAAAYAYEYADAMLEARGK